MEICSCSLDMYWFEGRERKNMMHADRFSQRFTTVQTKRVTYKGEVTIRVLPLVITPKGRKSGNLVNVATTEDR